MFHPNAKFKYTNYSIAMPILTYRHRLPLLRKQSLSLLHTQTSQHITKNKVRSINNPNSF